MTDLLYLYGFGCFMLWSLIQCFKSINGVPTLVDTIIADYTKSIDKDSEV